QYIAIRTGTSHTAFAYEMPDRSSLVKIRFITPTGEIVNCGHGSIAAHYVRAFELNHHPTKQFLSQETKEGVQKIEIDFENHDYQIWLTLNEVKIVEPTAQVGERLLDALGLNENALSGDRSIIIASPGSNRFLVGLKSVELVNQVTPDFEQLKKLDAACHCIGCFVFSIDKQENPMQVTARMFAPNIGVWEDAINGNSSGCLAAWLLSEANADSINMTVSQGQMLGMKGSVKVKASKIENKVEVKIGGTVVIDHEIYIQLSG
ncbi:MAG TPA: PhzF family phenazine biosynthesis isomerase, partial [Puia sp.]|nr:PhzF family phenazine biosynthesis isomerase [Puia sp.]